MPKKACIDHEGNQFKSIQDMCNFWHISRTTYENRRRLGLPTKECLQPKEAKYITYDHLGNQYANVGEMCKHYGIKRSTFADQISKGIPLETILTHSVTKISPSNCIECKDHLGNTYSSITEMAKHYGLKSSTLNGRLKAGYSLEEALTPTLRIGDYTDHLGNHFSTQQEMADYWGINVSTLAMRLRKGYSIEKALEIVTREVTDHKGVTYKSVVALAEAYGMTRSTVERRLKNGWSMEKTLTTPSTTRKKFKDHLGNEYATFAKMCKAWNMPSSTVQNRVYKLGLSLEEALTTPTNTQNTVGKTCKDHLGNVYQSVATMCCKYGLPRNVYHRRIKEGWDLEKALTTPPSRKNGMGRIIYDHKGNEYSSVGEMCNAYNIDFAMYGSRIRQGWSLEKTLTTPPEEIQIGKKECVDHLGNHFKSQAEMMRHWGVTKDQLRSRIELGWTLQQILESPTHQSHKRPCVDHLGNVWPSQGEMLEHYGVSAQIFKRRLNVMGLSLEEALTGHSLHVNQITDPLGNFFECESDMCKAWDVPTATYYHWMNKLHPGNMKMALTRPKTNWQFKDVKIIRRLSKDFFEVTYKNHNIIWSAEQICDYYISNFKPCIENIGEVNEQT